ncbi:MAG: PIN domain-containing protein [Desulfobacteraceae bacterium]|nr:MAG: PIN domain-containing protein [Desulfobacteraceae bacterium]
MKDKFFLDTNIIVYSFDAQNPGKQKTAQGLINSALSGAQGVVSYQVVQEFINVAIRKFQKPLSYIDCRMYVEQVLTPLCEIFPDIPFYLSGLNLSEKYHYSFYDSLIIAAALEAKCKTLFSEDFQHDQEIKGLKIVNPFV